MVLLEFSLFGDSTITNFLVAACLFCAQMCLEKIALSSKIKSAILKSTLIEQN